MHILIPERINDANEYVELLMAAYQQAGHSVILDVQNFLFSEFVPDVVHIQWPEAIYRWRHRLSRETKTLEFLHRRLEWYRDQGTTVVYTAHNAMPHDVVDASFERQLYGIILRHAHVVVHHGSTSIALLKESFLDCAASSHIVVPHGPYTARTEEPRRARRSYGIPYKRWCILNFGRQRKSKGPAFTRNVFGSLRREDLHLFTIGPHIDVFESLLSRVRGQLYITASNVLLRPIDKIRHRTTVLRAVPHDEIPRIMAASDILFLGHQSGWNSGVLALAASYSKPVVFPDLANFKEQLYGWSWWESYEAGSEESAAVAIDRILGRLGGYAPMALNFDNQEWRALNSWERQVAGVIAAVETVRGARP